MNKVWGKSGKYSYPCASTANHLLPALLPGLPPQQTAQTWSSLFIWHKKGAEIRPFV
jgi:hypothetical protein